MNRHRLWAVSVLNALKAALGAKCALCPRTVQLEFDCITPRGDTHHRWETNRRSVFYKREHAAGNLQLLCRSCHEAKSKKEQYWLWNQAADCPF